MVDNSGLVGGGGLETTVSLEAGENMSIGDTWFLGADGKAYKNRTEYEKSITLLEAYPYFVYGTAGNEGNLLLVDPSVNKILRVAKGDGNTLWAGITTVNSTTGEHTYNAMTDGGYGLSGSVGNFQALLKIGTNKALAIYRVNTTLYTQVIDYSSTIPTFGAGVNVSSVKNTNAVGVAYDSTNDKVLYAYPGGTNDLVCRVGSITGTSISWNSEEVISNNSTGDQDVSGVLFNETHSTFIVVYRSNANSGAAVFVDCSGASISVHSATSRSGDGSPSAPIKLSNGDYYAYVHDENTNEDLYLLFINMTSSSTDISRTLTLETAYSGDTNPFTAILDLGSGKVLAVVDRKDNSNNRSEYGYIATFDGSTATLVKSFPLPSTNVVKLGTGFGVYESNNNYIELFDNDGNSLGEYDFTNFSTSMPRFMFNRDNNAIYPREDQKLSCTNGLTIIPSSTSYKMVIETGNNKLVTLIGFGVVKEAVTSGQTYKFPVRLAKQGNKPIALTGSGIRPCESYYGTGDSLSLAPFSYINADIEYLGYCIADDVLIVNSSNAKET